MTYFQLFLLCHTNALNIQCSKTLGRGDLSIKKNFFKCVIYEVYRFRRVEIFVCLDAWCKSDAQWNCQATSYNKLREYTCVLLVDTPFMLQCSYPWLHIHRTRFMLKLYSGLNCLALIVRAWIKIANTCTKIPTHTIWKAAIRRTPRGRMIWHDCLFCAEPSPSTRSVKEFVGICRAATSPIPIVPRRLKIGW